MLLSLSIRDVVLIDRLDLSLSPGLSVLTGETGAGKSILLDSLGLALGARGDAGLVRKGAAQAVVAAAFAMEPGSPVADLLAEQGIETDDMLVLRRVLNADGRSRAFVNDQPVGIGLLKQLGDLLVEIQGQFEQRGLLDQDRHRALLDAFAGSPVTPVRDGWAAWQTARQARESAERSFAAARDEETWLRQTADDLDRLAPEPGEEEILAERRTRLMHRAQIEEAAAASLEALEGERGAERNLNTAARALERVRARAGAAFEPAAAAIERALVETAESAGLIRALLGEAAGDGDLESVEARLFDLRAFARKQGCRVDDLPVLRTSLHQRLGSIEDGEDRLRALAAAETGARAGYLAAAEILSSARREAASRFDADVTAELAPLRLDRARFTTLLTPLDEAAWGPSGIERVAFQIATNPGSAAGPLSRVASGGELSRLLLALKVVLARVSSVKTIVFDEVDAGIGGAVAAAVGERLQLLGQDLQVLVVTHSPQVAARRARHWRVAKQQSGETTVTRIDPLDPDERLEEIARMLSGASITDAARAAAASLLAASTG
jgi:DNA repair protein RecN (Recombination protein N)